MAPQHLHHRNGCGLRCDQSAAAADPARAAADHRAAAAALDTGGADDADDAGISDYSLVTCGELDAAYNDCEQLVRQFEQLGQFEWFEQLG